MHDASYYRAQAQRARRLAHSQTNRDIQDLLSRVARDYDDIAEDIEGGAVEIRHPELLPQKRP